MAESTFKTIHIFGYGETQLIGGAKDGKVSSNDLNELEAFVDHIKTFKPENVEAADLHVIHIFKDGDIRYLGKNKEFSPRTKTSFSVSLSQVNETLLNAFVNELIGALAEEEPAEEEPAQA
jgi:hypothetical protein